MKFTAVTAVFVVIVTIAIIFVTQISINPVDTLIVQVLEENEEHLLRIEGVVGAGIARDEKNHVTGIAVYVQEDVVDTRLLPIELDGYTIHIKPWSEATEFEKENMILYSTDEEPSRPSGTLAYVSNSWTNEVLVVDLVNEVIIDRIPTGGSVHNGPLGIAVTPDGGLIYVVNPESKNLLAINTTTCKIKRAIPVKTRPEEIVISPNGAFAYVVSPESGEVHVIDTENNTIVTTISVGASPRNPTMSSNGSLLLITSLDNIVVIDAMTNTVTNTISVGELISDVAFTPDSRYAYAGVYERGSVSVIDVEVMSVVGVIENVTLRQFPDSTINDLAVSPDGRLLYVADLNGGTLAVINTTTNAIIMKMKVEPPGAYGGPRVVAFSPDGMFTYLLYWGGIPIDAPGPQIPSSIAIVDTKSTSLIATIMLGEHAGAERMVIYEH